MSEQEIPEANADVDAAMDQTAARLRSQMSKTMAALQPRLTALANLVTTGLIARAAESSGAGTQETTPAG